MAEQDRSTPRLGLSRRSFLHGAALAGAGAFLAACGTTATGSPAASPSAGASTSPSESPSPSPSPAGS